MSSAARAPRHSGPPMPSLQVLPRIPPDDPEPSTQFRVLVRHFLDRFFTNELASADGDAKTRLVQVACALAIPGLVVALYLYTPYHMAHQVRPYWAQVGDHYFYTLYAMVAMGMVTIFEWDLLFPDLLDVFILSALPLRASRTFAARVAAIFILMGAALFDSSFLAPVVLPAATDPPHLLRFWAAHLVAVTASGIFGAAFFLALEAVLLGVVGDRLFRKISLWLQGFIVVALLTLLFLYPALAGALGAVLQSGSRLVWAVPPFWFLGIYQRILEGSSTAPVFHRMAHTGWAALAVTVSLAIAAYPLAWWRKKCGLVEGTAKREKQNRLAAPLHRALHLALARTPACRAIWQFIGQNLLRVSRYRMVLVIYGGMGAALVFAAVTRVALPHGRIVFHFSPQGLRATVPMIAFWTVSGLRSTFLAPADQRGRWIFRVILGKARRTEIDAARRWVFLWSALLSLAAASCACAVLKGGWHFVAGQALLALALSLLLTDAFFLNVSTIPFTGAPRSTATNFALLLIPYLGFFPAIVMFTVGLEPIIEASAWNLALAAGLAAVTHLIMRTIYRRRMAEYANLIEADEDEEEFPLRLGLRY